MITASSVPAPFWLTTILSKTWDLIDYFIQSEVKSVLPTNEE